MLMVGNWHLSSDQVDGKSSLLMCEEARIFAQEAGHHKRFSNDDPEEMRSLAPIAQPSYKELIKAVLLQLVAELDSVLSMFEKDKRAMKSEIRDRLMTPSSIWARVAEKPGTWKVLEVESIFAESKDWWPESIRRLDVQLHKLRGPGCTQITLLGIHTMIVVRSRSMIIFVLKGGRIISLLRVYGVWGHRI